MGKLDSIIKKHIVLTALSGFAVVLLMITITYGLYQTNHENTTDQEISLGDFDVDLTSTSGQITLSDLIPGVENSATYTFTTSNSGDYVVKYSVYFTDNTTTFLADQTNAQTYANYTQITSENYEFIEYKLDTGEYKPLSDVYDSDTGRFTIITGRLQPNFSYNHTVKFKVSSNAPNELQGSILALNITMDATVTEEVGTDTIMKLTSGASPSSTDVITATAPSGATCTNTLAYDGTVDNNLRYVGANPCNYVTFNGETAGWRIIGIMNNVEDGTGNTETRIKLIRATDLGRYSWDTSDSTVNDGYGVNDWTQADLMTELNGDYLDTTLSANTNWYNGRNNQQTGVFDYTKGLSQAAQSLIWNTKWHLGGHNTYSATASTFYTAERGTNVYSGRPTEWTGKVALIYPSDYGYAVGGTVRSTCLGKNLGAYNSDSCYTNDWIRISSNQWLLSPRSTSIDDAFYVLNAGYLFTYDTIGTHAVRPAVYLKSNVKISGGDGTSTNPYTLSL